MDYLIYNKETDELVDAIQLEDEEQKKAYEKQNPKEYLRKADKIPDIDLFQTGARDEALYE